MRRALIPVAVCLALAGCGGRDAPAAAPTATTAPPTTTTAPTSSAQPSTPGPSVGTARSEVGVTKTLKTPPDADFNAAVRITVLDYKTDAVSPGYRGETPRPGYKYGAILVRGCLVSADASVGFSWDPWTLTSPDGTTIEPVSSWSDEVLIAPLYPNDADRATAVGQCRKGWVPFAVPNGWRPSLVEYRPEGGETLTWRL
jgi:hypothetical protein